MTRTPEQLRTLERSLAYEHCCSTIDALGIAVEPKGADEVYNWLDLTDALRSEDGDVLREAMQYLDARGLLLRLKHERKIVAIKEEHEEAETAHV